MKKMIQKILILLLSGLSAVHHCHAHAVDTANPTVEISRVMGTMSAANHISFNIAFYYQDFSATGMLRDTISGIYKINGDKYYAKIDSTEMIQNDFYNVAVSKRDSSIIIGRIKTVFPAVVQTDLLDPLLQSNYLSKITLSDSAGTRKLGFAFNSSSPYSAYDFVYDTVSYNITYIKYSLRHYDVPGMQNTYYTQIKMVFSNYQTNAFTDSVFDTSVYFNRINGVFTATTPYSTFDIFNQSMNP